MFRSRSIATVVGVAIVASVATRSAALTPEEEAALREEARVLTEQARAQEVQAATARDLALQIFVSEFKKADAVDDQAFAKKILALQKWLQVDDKDEARASALRESAITLLVAAYRSDVLATLVDEEVGNEVFRATQQRAAADALLAASQDAETQAIAKELRRLADKDEREGKSFESQAARLRKEADATTARADGLIQRALELEAAP